MIANENSKSLLPVQKKWRIFKFQSICTKSLWLETKLELRF